MGDIIPLARYLPVEDHSGCPHPTRKGHLQIGLGGTRWWHCRHCEESVPFVEDDDDFVEPDDE